jgi:putative ABC transport system ATP-binding protein
MLEAKGIVKRYGEGRTAVEILSNLNFSVRAGDIIVIRGPSGSGKSTLLNLLGLLDSPSAGEIYLDGELVSFADFDALAVQRSRAISFIFQTFNLNPVLTAEENVMVPLMIRSDIPRPERQRRVAQWLANVGLTEHSHKRPDELSGGQRQRVAIARAMVSEPRLVIADEPTANLDSTTANTILKLMQELNQKSGTSFIFATHDPALDQFAKTRLRMKDGKLFHE